MKVKAILQNRLAAAASVEVLELDDESKHMVMEKRDLYQGIGKMATTLQLVMPHDAVQTCTIEDSHDDEPAECMETSKYLFMNKPAHVGSGKIINIHVAMQWLT